VEAADMQSAVAWKNGLFLFHDTDIRFVLRQIARWYDTDVTYDGEINARLNGMVSRNTELSKVLHMLELTSEVRFSIEDKKIIITPGQ
jgi:ferric-dicitrate binding protein FerR (iron transport regulator)